MKASHAKAVLLSLVALCCGGLVAQDNVSAIIQKSVEANNRDWDADPQFSYSETDREKGGTKTYEVTMLYGTPYNRLVAINGRKLTGDKAQAEQKKYDDESAKRRAETPDKRSARIEKYQVERKRDHTMLAQLTEAFTFTPAGEQTLGGHRVYVLKAHPRKGYHPPNRDSEVLPGMEGTLWVDKASSQWVKVEAHVIRPVKIEGFLAKVEPGTRFELEKKPVSQDVWLTSHFAMKSSAKVLMMFPHQEQEDISYSNYHKNADAKAEPSQASNQQK